MVEGESGEQVGGDWCWSYSLTCNRLSFARFFSQLLVNNTCCCIFISTMLSICCTAVLDVIGLADDEYSQMRAAGARIGGGQRNSLLH